MFNIANMPEMFAARNTTQPALIDPVSGVTRTYGALADRTDRLAGALFDELGVGRGGRIAALSRNSIELVELYIATARVGAMLFPLNWRFSATQVAEALLDAAPDVVFYEAEFADVVAEIRTRVDTVWVEWSTGKDSAYEELLVRVQPRIAEVRRRLPDSKSLLFEPYLAISTGGTSGIPKSAVHSQYSYGACTIDYLAATRVAEDDTYLMLGQLFHVVGYMAFAYLLRGRPVVVANFQSDGMLELIRQERVSAFMAIGAMLPRLVAEAEKDGNPPTTVRILEYGGAPMGADTIRKAGELFKADLMQTWGMTEFGPGTYLGPDAHRRALSGEKPELFRSCGDSALLSTLAVLDLETGRPVPRDGKTMGELCHRGPNNMIGYWNKPEETAGLVRGGWIHTGDGVTWDEEGFCYIVDRLKSMIISGGENIFPSEVERCLGDHPEITEAAVIGAPDEEWGEVVKAFVVRAPGSSLTEDEVGRYVGENLASYKKPRVVEFKDALPMTPTGKVNRKLLK
ncbi:class I adenylate-forming enzyme family protein [Amycolatopsis sp. FDAARGOS 1241]|uniref:class I adenylate-forming enzyme family protein n=1 Tax=Amycolatopsis sp. FDAARGOS 1241 TaxID=2778070 RepID=UPI00194EA52D|nr:AMP-binding protein [Amycolatopsis sp. FDAARGOS 1241]QRP42850.1 AMP-binding protein [Amycolatopsis sp. FDAARGOS 1241]